MINLATVAVIVRMTFSSSYTEEARRSPPGVMHSLPAGKPVVNQALTQQLCNTLGLLLKEL
jgi:hypothetical protein